MDIGQLRYFSKIVEHRSFTRAAQDFSVSQPALSQQIAKLERELGQPLFERQGRSIRLTPAGQVLQTRAEEILNLVDDAKLEITDDGQTGRICVSAIPTIAPYLMPIVLDGVGGQFPRANFSISEDTTEMMLGRCSRGDVDVGILAMPAKEKYLTVEPLFEEELVVALPVDHPLGRRTRISLKDISDEPFVMLSQSHCLVDVIDRFCNQKHLQLSVVSRVEQLATVKQLVALGHGLAFIPQIATHDDLEGRIVFRSLRGEKPTRQVAICWNPYRYQSQLLSNFIKGLMESCGQGFAESAARRYQPTSERRESVSKAE